MSKILFKIKKISFLKKNKSNLKRKKKCRKLLCNDSKKQERKAKSINKKLKKKNFVLHFKEC